ncbi:MAG TPA: hypothetical protein VIK86_02080 [Candidatus Paceibacterota bacterium]
MDIFSTFTRKEKFILTLQSISIFAILTVVYYICFILVPSLLMK